MAHLIKKIAMDRSQNRDSFIIRSPHNPFRFCSCDENFVPPGRQTIYMLKSVFSGDQPSPPLPNNQILKTNEFHVQSVPVPHLETQQNQWRAYDDWSITSYANSIVWHDVDWKGKSDDQQHNTSSIRNIATASSSDIDAHFIRSVSAISRSSS